MYNILVCDDEKDIVSALTIYLQAEGYQVFGASNGLQALETLRHEQIHLVLLDIMMPGLDGLHTMQRLREFSNVPVILLTAKSEDNDKILGGIELDDDAKTVKLDGEAVNLTPKEYDILRFLMQNPGKVFSPSEIYRRVWDDLPLNADNALAVHIRHIREKIEYNPAEPRYLKVVWGKGYKMEADPR